MINVTVWHPDTCECEIQYAWDSDTTNETRVHTIHKSTPCKIHEAHAPHSKAHYDAVLDENQRKNLVFKHVVETIPEFTTTDTEGNIRHAYQDYDWAFDENRVLHFTLKRGTPQQHSAVKTKVDRDFKDKAVHVDVATLEQIKDKAKAQAKAQQAQAKSK